MTYMTFDEFIKDNYPNFNYIYDWEHNPSTRMISSYLKTVMINTYNSGGEEIRKELPDLIHDLEYFFYYGIKKGFFTKNNIFNEKIINRLKKKCTRLDICPKN